MDSGRSAAFSGVNQAQQIGHQQGDNYIYLTKANEDARKEFIQAMDYTGINARRRQIHDAGSKDYDWIWTTCFKDWLHEENERIFWLTGKPASGKSTLMKYLATTKKLRHQLPDSRGQWLVVSFYFDFRAHDKTANSINGMLRSIAKQLVQSLPEATQNLDFAEVVGDDETKHELLIDVISRIVTTHNVPILAFIDGLDEFNGEASRLCKVIDLLGDRSGLKLCLSSRAEHAFSSAYKNSPTIRMQDFNTSTIEALVDSAVGDKQYLLKTAFSDDIRAALVEKAKGVILWAHLVAVQSLEMALQGKSAQDLKNGLDETPPALNAVYQIMLDKIHPQLRAEAAVVLVFILDQDAAHLNENISVMLDAIVFLSGQIDMNLPYHEQIEVPEFQDRLLHMFGGLLDIVVGSEDHSNDISRPDVEGTPTASLRLAHETLGSYLKTSTWINQNLPEPFSAQFPDAVWLRTLCLALERTSSSLSAQLMSRLISDKTSPIATLKEQNPSLCPRILSAALQHTIDLAHECDLLGNSSYTITRPAFNSFLALYLTCRTRGVGLLGTFNATYDQGELCIEDPILTGHIPLDITVAMHFQLVSYIEEHASASSGPDALDKEKLLRLYLYFTRFYNISGFNDFVNMIFGFFGITTVVLDQFKNEKVPHVGYALQHWSYPYLLSHFYSQLRRRIRPHLWQDSNQNWCDECESYHGLVYHWDRAAFPDNPALHDLRHDVVEYFTDLEYLLLILVNDNFPTCETNRINMVSLLHSVLRGPPASMHFRVDEEYAPQRLMKLILVIKVSLNQWSEVITSDLLNIAKKYQAGLKKRALKYHFRLEKDRFLRQKKIGMDAIVTLLKDHRDNGKWNILNRYYRCFKTCKDIETAFKAKFLMPVEPEAPPLVEERRP